MDPRVHEVEVTLRERGLRLDARKLSVEMLVKVHLESVSGARLLVLGHQRLMFTLSLAALAGVVTLFSAALRLGAPHILPLQPLTAGLGVVALLSLTASALLSALTLQRATQQANQFLREPYPAAQQALSRLFSPDAGDETGIVTGLLEVLEGRAKSEPIAEPRTAWTTALLLVGIAATGLTFML